MICRFKLYQSIRFLRCACHHQRIFCNLLSIYLDHILSYHTNACHPPFANYVASPIFTSSSPLSFCIAIANFPVLFSATPVEEKLDDFTEFSTVHNRNSFSFDQMWPIFERGWTYPPAALEIYPQAARPSCEPSSIFFFHHYGRKPIALALINCLLDQHSTGSKTEVEKRSNLPSKVNQWQGQISRQTQILPFVKSWWKLDKFFKSLRFLTLILVWKSWLKAIFVEAPSVQVYVRPLEVTVPADFEDSKSGAPQVSSNLASRLRLRGTIKFQTGTTSSSGIASEKENSKPPTVWSTMTTQIAAETSVKRWSIPPVKTEEGQPPGPVSITHFATNLVV